MTRHYDYIAVGSGSGDIASINRAAIYRRKCTLIRAKGLGGTCVNVGYVPKRMVWHITQVRGAIRMYSPDYGFSITINKFGQDRLITTRTAYIDHIHTSYDNMLGRSSVDAIKGFACSVGARTTEVSGKTIAAGRISIAAGGRPSHPSTLGVEYGIGSNGFFKLPALPKCVAVVGIGYIAAKLAGVINGLGAEVHLFAHKHAPLRNLDPMIVGTLVETMNIGGPTLHVHTIPKTVVKNADDSLTLQLEDGRSETMNCLIWVTGHEPETDNSNLAVTGVKTNEKGYVVVGKSQSTDVLGTYAVGNNIGAVELTPVAVTVGRHSSEHLFNNKPDEYLDCNNIPAAVFSRSPIDTVNLTERQTREQHSDGQAEMYRSSFTAMHTAVTSHHQPCCMKLVCVGPEKRIVGIHGIDFGTDETPQGFAIALRTGVTKKDFDNTAAIHPTAAGEFVTMR